MSATGKLAEANYKISEVPESDFDHVIDLWSLAFSISDADLFAGDLGMRERFRDFLKNGIDFLVGAYDKKRLAAVAGVIDFPTNLGSVWVDCGGIVGVATSPEYRRQRLVKQLLAKCVERLNERRFPLSALWPFSYPFYEQMGYAVTDFRYRIDAKLHLLRKVKGNALAYETVPLSKYEPAAACHERWVEGFNLAMRRSSQRWERLLLDPRARKRLFVHEHGYMLWNMTSSVDNRLEVQEWCWSTKEAFADGLALLAQMDSQFERARFIAHEVGSFLQLVGTDKSHSIEYLPGMMSRVVHLPAFFESLPVSCPGAISVDDPLEVTGTAAGGGGASVSPGRLLQHVLGTWSEAGDLPESLYKCVGHLPSLCIEQY